MVKYVPIIHKKIIKRKSSKPDRVAKHKKQSRAILKKEFMVHLQAAIDGITIYNRILMLYEKKVHLYSSHNSFRIKSEMKLYEYNCNQALVFKKPKTKAVLV